MGEADPRRTRTTLLQRLRETADPEAWNAAWNEFVRTYVRLILWVCARLEVRGADAEDVCQEVLRRVHHAMGPGGYQRAENTRFRSWLYRVIEREVLQHRRRDRRHRAQTGIEDVGRDLPGRVVRGRLVEDSDPSIPEIDLQNMELTCILQRALERIREEFPTKVYTAFAITSVRNEIGQDGDAHLSVTMDVPPGTVSQAMQELGWGRQAVYNARLKVWPRFKEIVKELTGDLGQGTR